MLYGITVKEDVGSFAPCLHSGFYKLLLGKCFLLFGISFNLRCEPTAQRFSHRDKKRGRLEHFLCRNLLPTNKLKKNHKAAVRDPRTQLSIGRRPLCAHTLRGNKRTSCCPLLIGKGFLRGTSFPLNDLLFPFLSFRKGKARGLGGGLSTPKSRGRNLLPTKS